MHDGRRQRAEVRVLQGVLRRDPVCRDPLQHPLGQVLCLIGQLVQPDPHRERLTEPDPDRVPGGESSRCFLKVLKRLIIIFPFLPFPNGPELLRLAVNEPL